MPWPRVLIISGDFPPFVSGVGDYADKFAGAMTEAGADVTVLTTVSTDAQDSSRKYRVVRSISNWKMSGRKAILDICRQGYDIIHFQYPSVNYGKSPMINLLPAMLRMSGSTAKTLLTVHDFRVMRRRWRARLAPMMWAVDGLIHVDAKDWDWIRAWGVGRNKPRAHIPIAANAQPVPVNPKLRLQWRNELGFGESETIVAFFGILYPHKGLTELVGAVQDLRSAGRQIRLLVLGDFDRQADWRPKMEQMLADPAVRWIQGAPLDQVSRYLHASDLAALPFHSGASTNRGSMLATLAHGLPTITTLGPATPRDFDREYPVMLVPVKDRTALCAAIGQLMDNAELRSKLRISSLFQSRSWAAVAAETLAFYGQLARAKSKETKSPLVEVA